ncbi:DUF3616 domain-containing protein [Rhodobacteraceae bacterium DSL-40]|uniref:DUF3616 domain-containing protein n=1 Tax=Amaricoccus sp. B4 TaxID=3368557 RepID=UPI000DADCC68
MPVPDPKDRLILRFRHHKAIDHVDDPIHQDLSAAARAGDSLFLSCDETAGVDRLTEADGHWGNHRHFAFGALIDLPDGPGGEMDIEGLDCDGNWLWVVGSHSLKRGKPKVSGHAPDEALRRMTDIKRDPNRAFLGRFPLTRRSGGMAPLAEVGENRAAHFKLSKKHSKLKRWLRDDPILGPFLDIPCKENGLDIEGIAARGLRVWLGLRGPVIGGMAVVIELDCKITGSGHLKPRRIDGKRRYRTHLLPTRGLGVRDLAFDGDDLLVLAGPAMAGDGPAHVLRWKDAVSARKSGVHPPEAVVHALDLPYRGKVDHPEGLVRWGEDWLVVYDSPAERRLEGSGAAIAAEIFSIP